MECPVQRAAFTVDSSLLALHHQSERPPQTRSHTNAAKDIKSTGITKSLSFFGGVFGQQRAGKECGPPAKNTREKNMLRLPLKAALASAARLQVIRATRRRDVVAWVSSIRPTNRQYAARENGLSLTEGKRAGRAHDVLAIKYTAASGS